MKQQIKIIWFLIKFWNLWRKTPHTRFAQFILNTTSESSHEEPSTIMLELYFMQNKTLYEKLYREYKDVVFPKSMVK